MLQEITLWLKSENIHSHMNEGNQLLFRIWEDTILNILKIAYELFIIFGK